MVPLQDVFDMIGMIQQMDDPRAQAKANHIAPGSHRLEEQPERVAAEFAQVAQQPMTLWTGRTPFGIGTHFQVG